MGCPDRPAAAWAGGGQQREQKRDKHGEWLVSKEQQDKEFRRDRAQQVGLFRFRLISEALNEELSTKQRGRLVREVAAQTHVGPFGASVLVSRATLDRWIRDYRQGGFAALVPHAGSCPALRCRSWSWWSR